MRTRSSFASRFPSSAVEVSAARAPSSSCDWSFYRCERAAGFGPCTCEEPEVILHPIAGRVALCAIAFACASPAFALAQPAQGSPIGPARVGTSTSYRVAWTTTVDGNKVASVSSVVTLRWRAGEKIVASMLDSDQPASVYVVSRANDGMLTLDNAANVDATGARLGQVLTVFDALAGIVAEQPPDATTWTKSVAIPAQPASSPSAPPAAAAELAFSVTRAMSAVGPRVTASGSSTAPVAATPAPAPMRLLHRIIREKPAEATTSCTIEERFAHDGSLISASFEEKTVTASARQSSAVVTSWYVAPTP
jgi:hypothetical protein